MVVRQHLRTFDQGAPTFHHRPDCVRSHPPGWLSSWLSATSHVQGTLDPKVQGCTPARAPKILFQSFNAYSIAFSRVIARPCAEYAADRFGPTSRRLLSSHRSTT